MQAYNEMYEKKENCPNSNACTAVEDRYLAWEESNTFVEAYALKNMN